MKASGVIDLLNKGLNLASMVSGPLGALGIPGAGLVTSLIDIAKVVQQRVTDGHIVATATEKSQIDEILEKLQDENDKLNDQIANS